MLTRYAEEQVRLPEWGRDLMSRFAASSDPSARLGLTPGAPPREVADAALRETMRVKKMDADPRTTAAQREILRTLLRSLTGIFVERGQH